MTEPVDRPGTAPSRGRRRCRPPPRRQGPHGRAADHPARPVLGAATGTVALRNALRGLAATGAGPTQLLAWLNRVTHHLTDNVTATAVCALYQPRPHVPRWARAGHLPPLLLRDGQARKPPAVAGILLGAIDQAEYEEGEIQLKTGDTLMLYTDGPIERRDRSLQDSIKVR